MLELRFAIHHSLIKSLSRGFLSRCMQYWLSLASTQALNNGKDSSPRLRNSMHTDYIINSAILSNDYIPLLSA